MKMQAVAKNIYTMIRKNGGGNYYKKANNINKRKVF